MTIDQMRAIESLALSLKSADAATVDRAKQLAALLPLIADDSEEFAALSDLVMAIAYKEPAK